jgi:antitoxin (DNA-binding transcriptional repressor) of toxin-antitoxin stability system
MTTVTLAEAKAKLEELVDHLAPGETIVIVKDDKPVAKLSGAKAAKPRPVFGGCRDLVTIVADDEEHLAGFDEALQ